MSAQAPRLPGSSANAMRAPKWWRGRSAVIGIPYVWLLLFFETTNLQAGWPLQRNPWMTLHAHLLWLANDVIHAICLVQATALVVAAFRRLNAEILRVDAEEPDPLDPDAFPPDRDPFAGLGPGQEGFTAV